MRINMSTRITETYERKRKSVRLCYLADSNLHTINDLVCLLGYPYALQSPGLNRIWILQETPFQKRVAKEKENG